MQDTAGEAGTNSWVMYSNGPPHMAVQKQDDQHEHTISNYVRIRDVVQNTCLRRWTIGKSGEKGSGISVLPARHDDDDDDDDDGITTWTLTKCIEKKLDGNYTKMLRAVLNKSWRQHPSKKQLYVHQTPILKTVQIRRTDMWDTAGEVRTNLSAMYSCGTLHKHEQGLGVQL